MIENIAEFNTRLNQLDPSHHDFDVCANELVEDVSHEIGNDVCKSIFRFFERHQTIDCGSPGPLVYFIEEFYPAYLEYLIDSVRQVPSVSGVFMINRVLFSNEDAQISDLLLATLTFVMDSPFTPAEVIEVAAHSIAFHS